MSKSLPKLAALPAAVLSLGVLAVGCGPITFQGAQDIVIAGQAPKPPEPPPERARVEVKDDKIEIHEKIQFEYNKSDIKTESHDLLNEVVQVIKANPHIKKIAIEGHASAEGGADYNLRLSDARAKAVREYLVTHGIGEDMLTATGYGITRPIASNDTEDGREKNRRVEFNIVEQEPRAATQPEQANAE